MRKIWLGWERKPLEAAADWLAGAYHGQFAQVCLALPGSRAGRKLNQRLARKVGPNWHPPDFQTAGALTDTLLAPEAPLATRLLRTLAWQQALENLPPALLRALVAYELDVGDRAAWMRLAENVRSLFGTLAAEAIDFQTMAQRQDLPEAEQARWQALAHAQAEMQRVLARGGFADPHLARMAALAAGKVRTEREVILVGVVEMNALLARSLQLFLAQGGKLTTLIFAPEEEAAAFDELGRIRVEVWKERYVPLTLAHWKVVQELSAEANEVVAALQELGGKFAAEEIVIGVANTAVTESLTRELHEYGLQTRAAAGQPLAASAPLVLLRAVADFLAGQRYASFAALLRHPDLEAALLREAGNQEWQIARLLDDYEVEHLPGFVGATWCGPPEEQAALQALAHSFSQLLGSLGQKETQSLAEWAVQVRAFLLRVYQQTDPAQLYAAEANLRAALELLGTALAEMEALPSELAPETDASEALEWLEHLLAQQTLPPPAGSATVPTLELLGWLELALDDAPALIVTGFEEGHVPESFQGDAWLPNGLRRRLGIEDSEGRLARDVYITTLCVHSRPFTRFISARRSFDGEPLLPSRIAFLAPPAELGTRVHRMLDPRAPSAMAQAEPPAGRSLPRRAHEPLPQALPVSAFRLYLESPYLFYLRHILRLQTFAHDGLELDAAAFGSLAHEVLAILSRPELCQATDASQIAQALEAELSRLAEQRFSRQPLAAVELQIDQLAWRLRQFAKCQAQRAEAGWRVAYTEWQAPAPVALQVDGVACVLRGRIDRIDVHENGSWAILDYKTSERKLDPEKAHRRHKEEWMDLQLPLYSLLACELDLPGVPELGYALCGPRPSALGFAIAAWDEEVLASAFACAQDVVRRIRKGEWFDVGRARPQEPIWAALLGQGLLSGAAEAEEAPEEDS